MPARREPPNRFELGWNHNQIQMSSSPISDASPMAFASPMRNSRSSFASSEELFSDSDVTAFKARAGADAYLDADYKHRPPRFPHFGVSGTWRLTHSHGMSSGSVASWLTRVCLLYISLRCGS